MPTARQYFNRVKRRFGYYSLGSAVIVLDDNVFSLISYMEEYENAYGESPL